MQGTGIGFLNHHAKKGSKMVVMMDLDQILFPLTCSKLWCFFLFPLINCIRHN